MHRIFAISTTGFLFIALGALIVPKAVFSSAPGVEAAYRTQAQDWSRFLPSDRSVCLDLVIHGSGTNTDLLSCLEAKAGAQRLARSTGIPG